MRYFRAKKRGLMKTFKTLLAEVAFVKKQFRFDKSLGDRERVTGLFLKDKSKFTSNEKNITRKFFRKWKAVKGVMDIFETKFFFTFSEQPKKTIMIYAVEVSKSNPSIHAVVVRYPTADKTGSLYTWVRIFSDYMEYSHYLTFLRSQKGRLPPI